MYRRIQLQVCLPNILPDDNFALGLAIGDESSDNQFILPTAIGELECWDTFETDNTAKSKEIDGHYVNDSVISMQINRLDNLHSKGNKEN